MYIKDIDNIIVNTLNTVFYKWAIEKKSDNLIDINILINEQNLVKYQKNINISLDLLFTLISQEDIQKIVNKNLNINLLNNIIKKYIAYFIFLFAGILSKNKIESFNNNLVEFSRNQVNYPIKINDFFNAESNSLIIKSISFIRDLFEFFNKLIIVEKKEILNIKKGLSRVASQEKVKKNTKNAQGATGVDVKEEGTTGVDVKEEGTTGVDVKEEGSGKYQEYINTILLSYSVELTKFINSFSTAFILSIKDMYVNTFLETKDVKQQYIFIFKIIKLMITDGPYLYKVERTDIFNKIDSSETSNGEYIFIDVLIPQNNFIDYTTIESILDPDDLFTDMPDIINKMINEDYSYNLDEKKKYYSDMDHKIQKLFDTGIIIPIVDDYLLFNKDNEKYVKEDNTKISSKDDEYKKNKEDTKIKYIINKLNTVGEYYKNEKDIKKLFYTPLQNRNAVLINNYEDIKIINKLSNTGKGNNENIDLLTDLKNYKSYPYFPFRDFEKSGFRFFGDKTTSSYRNINFNKKTSHILESRIINDISSSNIVGFAIISSSSTMECLHMSDFVDINNMLDVNDKSISSINIVTSLIEDKIKNKLNKNHVSTIKNNYYWLFDSKNMNINIPNYDISSTMNKNEVSKIFMSYLYDNLIENIINIFKKDISTKEDNYIYKNLNKLELIKKTYPDVDNSMYAKSLNDIDNIIYNYKNIKEEDIYDYNEDIFPGLYGNLHILPFAPLKIKQIIPKILIENIDFKVQDNKEDIKEEFRDFNEDLNSDTTVYINALCQHIISLDKITEIKKYNETLYSKLIYEYTQQYVETDANQNYICKSCKSDINIKKFVVDGAYNNLTQTFIPLSISITSYIEDLPEYDKYKIAIKNIDKIIDKIGSILDLSGLTGNAYISKNRRRLLIKDIIDLILNNNKNLEQYFLVRDKTLKEYNLSKEKSNLFKFTLENDIFIYSSKDKDKSIYKIKKYNNVISYITIILILELDDSQILNFKNDKICSYLIYKKLGYTLFEGIKIITNKSYDLSPINEYPVLCYIIFLFSCFYCKYNIWGDLNKDTTDSKKFDLGMQKSIIHTIIELLNMIIKVDIETSKKNKIYIYDILITKYFLKFDLFKNKDLNNRLDILHSSSTTLNIKENLAISTTSKFDIEPNNKIENDFTFDNLFYDQKKYAYKRYTIPKKTDNIIRINSINNLTNCTDGSFHKFVISGITFKCKLCNIEADIKALDTKKTPEIYRNVVMIYLRKLSKKYCKDGKIHIFTYDKNHNYKCVNCSYIKDADSALNDKALLGMYSIIEKHRINMNNYISKIIEKVKSKDKEYIEKVKKVYEKIIYKFKKNNDNINTELDILLDNIQKLVGLDILIEKNIHNLYNNIYIIDHDINGSQLDTPLQVYDNDKKFRIIENHQHYKRDVLVHTVQKNTKYEVFYDLYKKYLIGYREINKEYINIEKVSCKIKVIYSIKNIFLMFGFTRQYINTKDIFPDLHGYSTDNINNFKNKDDFKMNFLNNIFHHRFTLIKKLCNNININVYRLYKKFKFTLLETTELYDAEIINNPIDVIYNKFFKKTDNPIQISDKDKTHTFLKYNNIIHTYLPYEKFNSNKKDDIKITENINFDALYKNDFNSNLILNYLLTEIIRLLDYNTNKVIKTNIISLILEITVSLFNTYNMDIYNFDKDVDHFNQILYTSDFYIETQNIDNGIDIIDYYDSFNADKIENITNNDEKAKIIAEKEDDIEEQDALDIDGELDNEGMFESYYDNAPSRNVDN